MSKDQEAIVGILEPVKVQAAEVMTSLKDVEDSVISVEVILESIASDALNSGETCINLNLVSEDNFDCNTLNHIS